MTTVVIRLWEPAQGDTERGVLRGVVEVIGLLEPLPFVGERALLEILRRALIERPDGR